MKKYKYQVYIVSDKGIEIKVVFARSESDAMDIVFERMPEGAILKSIKQIN
jgi:hypothetical protein